MSGVFNPPSYEQTTLSPWDELLFQLATRQTPWYQQFPGGSPNLDDPLYDYRGAFQEGFLPQGPQGHWPSKTSKGKWLKHPTAHPTAWMEDPMSLIWRLFGSQNFKEG